jgi:hypothetical protein
VLPNCQEYLHLCEGEQPDPTRRELSRALFNAIVALDSAVDHAFYSEPRDVTFAEFFRQLSAENPVIGEVRELANAMKHCVTRRADRLDGAELAQGYIDVEIDLEPSKPRVKVELGTDLLDDADRVMEAAFKFWFECAHQMDVGTSPFTLTRTGLTPEGAEVGHHDGGAKGTS